MPSRPQTILGWSQLAWFGLIVAAWTVAVFRLPLDPDYTAGEMLDHLMGWQERGLLYPALGQGPTLRVLNYPPLVIGLARGLSALGIGPLLAGRLVNIGGLLLLVAVVRSWARARGGRGVAVAGTVGLLAASYGIVYGAAQFHLELWAVALTAGGYRLLESASDRRSAALGGLVLALACFAKQSQVVPALVALAWFWRARPDLAGRALVTFVGVGAVGMASITMAWGIEPWRHMLTYTTGTYSLANLGIQWLSHVAPWLLLLGFAATTLAMRRAGRSAVTTDPLAWYWIASLVWSLASARIGSGYPYFLDLHVATVLIVGPRLFGAPLSRRWAMALTLQVIGADIGAVVGAAVPLLAASKQAAQLPLICATFPARGPVLTEAAGLARACGRQPVMHPFIMTSLADRGLWSAARIEADVRAGRYAPILLPFDPRVAGRVSRERWSAGLLNAFRAAPSVRPGPGGLWMVR